jgi:hypothetical protein
MNTAAQANSLTDRIRARYSAMTPAELADELAWQREVLNTTTDSDALARAAMRLDILADLD